MSNELINSVKKREDAEIFIVTNENRDHLHEEVIRKALDFLSKADA
jgi:nucleoside-triphosphatase THEP1